MRQISPNGATGGDRIGLQVDNAIRGDRIGNTLNMDLSQFLTVDRVLHLRKRLIRNEDGSRWSLLFEARGKIHGAADYRVIHPVLAAEVADGAVVCVNADAAA